MVTQTQRDFPPPSRAREFSPPRAPASPTGPERRLTLDSWTFDAWKKREYSAARGPEMNTFWSRTHHSYIEREEPPPLVPPRGESTGKRARHGTPLSKPMSVRTRRSLCLLAFLLFEAARALQSGGAGGPAGFPAQHHVVGRGTGQQQQQRPDQHQVYTRFN